MDTLNIHNVVRISVLGARHLPDTECWTRKIIITKAGGAKTELICFGEDSHDLTDRGLSEDS